MTEIGYHASHEQFAPSELLEYVTLAQQAGFSAAMCSDHFNPWTSEQGQSGFAWSWLGAALQATDFSFGVVTVPGGWRYHPAILAQAIATLCEMYPGRLWVAPGSGEWLNEHIVGTSWPAKWERNERLLEGVRIMRALWAGESVSSDGPIPVSQARLWTKPQSVPPLIGAALTPATAHWLGGWADGLITVNAPREELDRLIGAFYEGGGEGKPVYLQVHLSYAPDEDVARSQAYDQWRSNIFSSSVLAELRTPEQFEQAGRFVKLEDISGPVRISGDAQEHIDWIEEDLDQGFAGIFLHQVGRDQRAFIDFFGEKVLPRLPAGRK